MAQVEFDDRDRPLRLFLVTGEARIEAGLRGEDLSALRLADDLSICGQRLFADLDGELVRVSEQVVEPVRILVGAGRRGEYVDTDGLNVEPNVHPRLFASTRLEPVENCIERRVIEKLASSPHRERRPASLTERGELNQLVVGLPDAPAMRSRDRTDPTHHGVELDDGKQTRADPGEVVRREERVDVERRLHFTSVIDRAPGFLAGGPAQDRAGQARILSVSVKIG